MQTAADQEMLDSRPADAISEDQAEAREEASHAMADLAQGHHLSNGSAGANQLMQGISADALAVLPGADLGPDDLPSAAAHAALYRPLNVKDALSYLDDVKLRFRDVPEVYNRFLDVMKEFKTQTIDTPGVIARVSTLFKGHPALIQGFNTFLPPGYRIECLPNADGTQSEWITVITPEGTTRIQGGLSLDETTASLHLGLMPQGPPELDGHTTPGFATPGAANVLNALSHPFNIPTGGGTPTMMGAPGLLPGTPGGKAPIEFNHAITYVNKIKNRFVGEPDTYKKFLEILQTYQKEGRPIQDVYAQVSGLFGHAEDLLDEFKQFLPDPAQPQEDNYFGTPGQDPSNAGASGMYDPHAALPGRSASAHRQKSDGPPPAKKKRSARPAGSQLEDAKGRPRKRKPPTTAMPQEPMPLPEPLYAPPLPTRTMPPAYNLSNYGVQLPHHLPIIPPVPPPIEADESSFFERVAKWIDDKKTYHDFLKLLNLFAQDLIDLPALVSRAYLFLGQNPDLWAQFRGIVGWNDGYAGPGRVLQETGEWVITNVPTADTSWTDAGQADSAKFGPSYRKLPSTAREVNQPCSGRDALCWDVLNDELISHPTWAAADDGFFIAHKKNTWEENLQRSEEERFEYDFHIEANARTIALLEPIAARIQLMDPEDRIPFRLKTGLGGQSKSIYQRVVKKVYGKEHGVNVIHALHENPCVAVPIVLARLKQKDEEWKRALREWNRVWREIDAKNFFKSLDHKGAEAKVQDKKAVQMKTFVSEIETIRREQQQRSLIGSLDREQPPTQQLAAQIEDSSILFDIVKLSLSYLDRVSATGYSLLDKSRIEALLKLYLRDVFLIPQLEVDKNIQAAVFVATDAASDVDPSEDGASNAGEEAPTPPIAGKKGAARRAADLRKQVLRNADRTARGRKGEASAPVSPMLSSPALVADPGSPSAISTDGTEDLNLPDATADEDMPPVPATNAGLDGMEGVETVDALPVQSTIEVETSTSPLPLVEGAEPVIAITLTEEIARRSDRPTWNFFCGSSQYALVRLLHFLYDRLWQLKRTATVLSLARVAPSSHPQAAPVLSTKGVYHTPSIDADAFYDNLLALCERFCNGELDSHKFEDAARNLFGTEAWRIFSVDSVIRSIIRTAHHLSDPQHVNAAACERVAQELAKDRADDATSRARQVGYRSRVESALGSDANFYRVETAVRHDTLYIGYQLLGRDDLLPEDEHTAKDQWEAYLQSYTRDFNTEGLPAQAWRADGTLRSSVLLPRNVRNAQLGSAETPKSQIGLESRVCLRSYRMFFVSGTGDTLHRKREEPTIGAGRKLEIFRQWLDTTLQQKQVDQEVTMAQEVPDIALPAETSSVRDEDVIV
ncbi:uncharacterized protein L969DRAFT_88610 [Mixia osmundae IAM 14324]|uniref:Histone deacetylase interacting domain-containing protein n=1 Tax=Mixia osmundae (strain CBS 9802 / IAM 14324 / JCM 22182 / KY 12970) TaxID=764103 RepID=G7E6M5_MIXOS|nr:uncharacterized protein L969DRAFT_88610 [Mixia osmundae IAM 14324]KEI39137.1 hypothetical protein L969DRAFT_88610 [Mixia osmundae IAM 14324]GAA98485.1 hypothetical protein E5Q_05171 [Mixia osmundae IAM 14324]